MGVSGGVGSEWWGGKWSGGIGSEWEEVGSKWEEVGWGVNGGVESEWEEDVGEGCVEGGSEWEGERIGRLVCIYVCQNKLIEFNLFYIPVNDCRHFPTRSSPG